MKKSPLPRKSFLLTLLFATSFFLHVIFISSPAQPVFDEAHFATYAAEYSRHEAHFDIHPPLGKLLYAAVLTFFPKETHRNASFITIDTRNGIRYTPTSYGYEDFPYVSLRLLASLFGALLPVVGYLLLESLTKNPWAPLWAGFLLLFENALLMETRLVLLNGMVFVFGFLSLVFFFGKKRNLFLSGILLGFALSVKLTAIVFVLLMLFGFMMEIPRVRFRQYQKDIASVGALALFVLGCFIFIHLYIVSPEPQIQVLRSFGAQVLPALPEAWNAVSPTMQSIAVYTNAFIAQFQMTVGYYLGGADAHIAMSPWYVWPFAGGAFAYYFPSATSSTILLPLRSLFESHRGEIGIVGNVAVWLLGTISVLWTFWFFIRKKFRFSKFPAPALLFAGWVVTPLPFALFVKRAAFLYHYFPALIFGTLLAACWIGTAFELISPKTRWWVGGGLTILIVGCFILATPYTYGF